MDYADILTALSARGARFAVAGGFACLAHGVVRITMDLDLVIEVTDDNLIRIWDTLAGLGFAPQQPISRGQGTSASELLRLSSEKNRQALSWVHGSQGFLIVDLLIGEPFVWAEESHERLPMFGVEAVRCGRGSSLNRRVESGASSRGPEAGFSRRCSEPGH